jgi:hypothetical protein
VLFIQIWITTSVPMDSFFQLGPDQFLKQFQVSIANLVWHLDTSYLVGSLSQHWPLWLVVGTAVISAILFYCLFVASARKEAIPPAAGSSNVYLDVVLVVAVFCALVAPTVVLESTTAIWAPSSRSRMVQQVFQPVLYLSILFLLTEYLIRRAGQWIQYVRNAGVALLCALAVILGLEYNRKLTEQSAFERKLETGLKKVVPVLSKPTHFVVKMKGMSVAAWYSGAAWLMPSLFVETAYNSDAVWLDPVFEGEPQASKAVIFGSNQQGIYSPESGSWVPYEDVVLLEFDGQRVTRLTNLDRETFFGYGARYAREEPLAAGS